MEGSSVTRVQPSELTTPWTSVRVMSRTREAAVPKVPQDHEVRLRQQILDAALECSVKSGAS